mgnify:CR=1 FL=1
MKKGAKLSAEVIEKMRLSHLGKIPWNKGKPHKKETIIKMSESKMGHKNKMFGKKHSEETKRKIGEKSAGRIPSEETRRKMSYVRKRDREKNHLWKGGINDLNDTIRKSLEYKLWREAVFKRDDFVCQVCFKRGGEINADHIKQFAYYPELRFDINNGRTLCVSCHKKTDTYSRKL